MDMSQLSEFASMMNWASASEAELTANTQHLDVPPQEQINKIFLTSQIKQEVRDYPGVIPLNYNAGQLHGIRENVGVFPIQGYLPGHMNPPTSPEQVPMDDLDPLESFTFWDGENFYSQQDACAASTYEMQTDIMPVLSECMAEDDISRDDVFPIKETDLLNNPTLAELNSCNDALFEYNVDNFITEDNSFPLLAEGLSKTFPTAENHFQASPVGNNLPSMSSFAGDLNFVPSGYIDIKQNTQSSLSSSCPASSRFVPNSQFLSPCDEKFLLCPQNSPASDSFFSQRMESVENKNRVPLKSCTIPPSPLHAAQNRLQEANLMSSSAPPDVTMATYFTKVKSEPPSHSPGPRSVTERSLSGFSSLSLSNDDESGSFFDSDAEDDFSSDEDVYQYESDELSTSWQSGKEEKSCQHRKHRYFWQYNLQSRGSKTQNILPKKDSNDPHVLNDAFDPVFSEECALPVKHSGKARKGDGNDLTPNPCKLYNIGVELKKLNKLIYNINPNEMGSQGKPLSRKEKNKLASRVCRLKKKAQHEANKIKLYGLQQEHKKLLTILIDTKELLRYKIQNMHDAKVSNCSKKLENYLAENEPRKVAGNTAAFVNEVLEKVGKGECDGGLKELK